MPIQTKVLLSAAGASLLVATIAGAVGSHALPLVDQALRSFETAVQFQFFHGLGVIGAVVVGLQGADPGIVAVAPYGGVSFMIAWLAFAVSPWVEDRRA
jgi:uncharacterized membrane protein YgdD (TMEM256/DUF423 family)